MNKPYAKFCIASFFALAVSGCGQGSGTSAQSSVSFPQNPIVLTRGSAANVVPVYTGEEKPIACQITPVLPEGLVLNPDCRISGTPVAPATQTTYVLQATYQTGPSLSFSPPIQRKSVFQASLKVDPAHIYIGAPRANSSEGAFYECNTDGAQCRQISLPITQTGAANPNYFGESLSANRFGLFVGAPNIGGTPQDAAVYRCSFPIEAANCTKLDVPLAQDVQMFGASIFATDNAVFIGDGYLQLYKCNADGTQCALFKNLDDFGLAGTIFATKQNILLANYATSEVKQCDLSANNCNTIARGDSGASDFFGSSLLLTDNALYVGAEGTNAPAIATGTIYKCNINGSKCVVFPKSIEPALPTAAFFGSSLAVYNGDLYTGASGENKIFKCSLASGACSEFTASGTDGTAFGSALAFF